jgi:hypothetical protein
MTILKEVDIEKQRHDIVPITQYTEIPWRGLCGGENEFNPVEVHRPFPFPNVTNCVHVGYSESLETCCTGGGNHNQPNFNDGREKYCPQSWDITTDTGYNFLAEHCQTSDNRLKPACMYFTAANLETSDEHKAASAYKSLNWYCDSSNKWLNADKTENMLSPVTQRDLFAMDLRTVLKMSAEAPESVFTYASFYKALTGKIYETNSTWMIHPQMLDISIADATLLIKNRADSIGASFIIFNPTTPIFFGSNPLFIKFDLGKKVVNRQAIYTPASEPSKKLLTYIRSKFGLDTSVFFRPAPKSWLDDNCTLKNFQRRPLSCVESINDHLQSFVDKKSFICDDPDTWKFCIDNYEAGTCDSFIERQCREQPELSNTERCSCFFPATTEIGKANYHKEKVSPQILADGASNPECVLSMCKTNGWITRKQLATMKNSCTHCIAMTGINNRYSDSSIYDNSQVASCNITNNTTIDGETKTTTDTKTKTTTDTKTDGTTDTKTDGTTDTKTDGTTDTKTDGTNNNTNTKSTVVVCSIGLLLCSLFLCIYIFKLRNKVW